MNEKEIKEYCNKVAYFSVGPQKGQRKRKVSYGNEYVVRSEIAIKGKCILEADRTSFYGGPGSRDFESKVLVNPTWNKVFSEFKKAMASTLDVHHVFLEGVIFKETRNGIPVYEFSVGS